MFPMQNFEPESAMISVSSNSALIEKYLRNTCLGQGAVPSYFAVCLDLLLNYDLVQCARFYPK